MAENGREKELHNMRQPLPQLCCAMKSRKTVEDPADADDEIRYLCASLATGTE